jgi:hypothetical protein
MNLRTILLLVTVAHLHGPLLAGTLRLQMPVKPDPGPRLFEWSRPRIAFQTGTTETTLTIQGVETLNGFVGATVTTNAATGVAILSNVFFDRSQDKLFVEISKGGQRERVRVITETPICRFYRCGAWRFVDDTDIVQEGDIPFDNRNGDWIPPQLKGRNGRLCQQIEINSSTVLGMTCYGAISNGLWQGQWVRHEEGAQGHEQDVVVSTRHGGLPDGVTVSWFGIHERREVVLTEHFADGRRDGCRFWMDPDGSLLALETWQKGKQHGVSVRLGRSPDNVLAVELWDNNGLAGGWYSDTTNGQAIATESQKRSKESAGDMAQ